VQGASVSIYIDTCTLHQR